MALPNVHIEIQNGAIPGSLATDDGLCGILLQGPAATGLALLTPKLINSLEEAQNLGIDAAFDSSNSVRCYTHLKDFYAEAGAGRAAWIMFVPQVVSLAEMVDQVETDYAKKLLDAARGAINILVVTRSPAGGYVSDTEDNAIDEDVVTAIGRAQSLAEFYEREYSPILVVVEGVYYTGVPGDLVDLKQRRDSNVVAIIGGGSAGYGAAAGLLAGRIASLPVHVNIGSVERGALEIEKVYLSDEEFSSVFRTAETIHDKGFVTLRQYAGRAGFFFTNDPTATGPLDDYRRIAYRRTINKAIRITYRTMVEKILSEVEVDSRGRIEVVQAKAYQALIENAINVAMTSEGEILEFSAFVDPDKNVLADNEICVEARIRPYGYADFITVNLGFAPAN